MSTPSERRIATSIAKKLKGNKGRRNLDFDMRREAKKPTIRRMKRQGKIEGVINGVATGGPDGPERKKQDFLQANTNVAGTAPFLASLYTGIAQGTQSNQRVGDRITVKSIDFEANVTQFSSTGSSFMDVFLVWDKEPDQSITTAATIFTNANTNLTFTAVAATDRFVILRREQIAMDSSNIAKSIKWHVPFDLGIKWAEGTGSPMSNDVLVVALCPGTSGGASSANIAFIARTSYIDA